MTIDCPLTCYICGKTPEDAMTVDLIGCLKNSQDASKRFKEKFGREAKGYLFICDNCRKREASYAKNIEDKYGMYDF